MTMCADTLAVSTARGIVSVKSLDITPNYEKTEFARRNPKHTDWTFCELGAITATGVDIAAAVYRKHLAADSVVIGRLDVGSYKDRNVERVEWVKSMFYEGLHKLPLTVDVRSIDVAAGSAFYEELPAGEPQSATVRFSDLKAKVYDLSNMAEPTAKNITVDASARLMSQGELKVRFLAPASPSDDRFEIIGSLGPVDMAAFNPLAEPLAKVRIDRGRIDKIDFHVTGVTRTSRVEMTMLYAGLYAMILKEDAPGETHDRKFLSELANDIVLRDSNPDGHGKLHHGSGTAERDMYKSQFNYMWRSLLPGIAESVGIPKALIHEKTADTSPGAHATPNEAKTHTGLIPMLLKSTSGD
jgi:hypothetical protein